MTRVRDTATEFRGAGVEQIVGISGDSPFSHAVWAKQIGLDFPLLSDWNFEAARAFGVLRAGLFGFGEHNTRGAFLVDREGIARHTWVAQEPTHLPDQAELLEAARSLLSR